MALSSEERAKAKYHLGYLQTDTSASISLGVPSAAQPFYLVERQLNDVKPESEFLVRRALKELDCIEDQLSKSRERYGISRVDETRFDGNEESRLGDQYVYWSDSLADILGVQVNPFSNRHRRLRGDYTVIHT